MKQIKITHYSKPNSESLYTRDYYYSVALGNDVKRSFTDIKQLNKFFVSVNNDLNICMVEIISIYTDLLKLYWQAWFYDYQGNDEIYSIEKYLNLAVNRSSHTNGNHFTFNHLNGALLVLKQITKELIVIRTSKNHYAEVRQLNALLYRISNCKLELSLIGSKS